ncbi:MAG: hypothetical protein M3Q95_12105 [Bacteroidota bacterium]|nr:hypothetical protein [Bacteroidota bacterium]
MKLIRDHLILLVIIALFYVAAKYLVGFIFSIAGVPYVWPFDILLSCCIVFFLLGISYKRLWTLNVFNKRKSTFYFVSLISFMVIGIWYVIWLEARSSELYNAVVEENVRGWKGRTHQPDDTLGSKPVPGAMGFHTFPIGDDIPMKYNEYGFRVPVSEPFGVDYSKGVDLLFLGCSFTYGDACLAEQTFPYLTAVNDSLTYINAGVGSYGLSQMFLLAQRLIPKYKPRNVIIQYSPWLVDRGTSLRAPTYYGSLFVPYFSGEGDVQIQYPLARTQIFNIDRDFLRKIYKDQYLKFFIRIGLPFYIRESVMELKIAGIKLFHLKPLPAKNKLEVEEFAYNAIYKLAEQNGGSVIILNLGDASYTSRSNEIFSPEANVKFAQADSVLHDYLKTSTTKDYTREFNHWRLSNGDSVLVDGHPNAVAHWLIAKSIKAVLE